MEIKAVVLKDKNVVRPNQFWAADLDPIFITRIGFSEDGYLATSESQSVSIFIPIESVNYVIMEGQKDD